MRIIFVSNRFPNPKQVFLHNKIIAIAQSGVKVFNLSGSFVSHKELSRVNRKFGINVCVYNYNSNFLFLKNLIFVFFKNPSLLLKITKICFRNRSVKLSLSTLRTNLSLLVLSNYIDVIHFEWNNSATMFLEAIDLIKKPYVVSIRGRGIASQPESDAQLKVKLHSLFKKATFIHSISYDLVKYLKQYPHNSTAVRVINPALDLGMIREKKQRDWPEIRIITVAHYRWKKNLPMAIHVIFNLIKMDIPIRYELVGEGPDREHLQYLINEFGVAEHITLQGHKSHDWVLDRLSNSDIFLMPSIQEGFCNSVLEAQATGIPCVVTDAEGLSENIEDGKTGFVVPRFDQEKMIKALLVLIQNSELRNEFGRNGRSRAFSKFDSTDQIAMFLKLYNDTINLYAGK